MFVLISYDITDNKTRTRIMKYLLNYGKRVQKSVFVCHITDNQLETIKNHIKSLITSGIDRVRYWEICKACVENYEIFGIGSIDAEDDVFWIVG